MTRTTMGAPSLDWTDPDRPVARTLDLVGDRWSLLVVRDAMDGARSFTEFQRRTGIARNILTDRLRKLTAHGVLAQRTAPSGRRQEYVLTDAGRALFPSSSRCASGASGTPSPPARPTPSWSTDTARPYRNSRRPAPTAHPSAPTRRTCRNLSNRSGVSRQLRAQEVEAHRAHVQGVSVEALEVERGAVAAAGGLARLQPRPLAQLVGEGLPGAPRYRSISKATNPVGPSPQCSARNARASRGVHRSPSWNPAPAGIGSRRCSPMSRTIRAAPAAARRPASQPVRRSAKYPARP